MPLTYQPFAETPALAALRPAPALNVGEGERVISAVCGAVFGLMGLSRGTAAGTLLAVLGGALVYRGVTGHCHTYEALGIDTAKSLPSATLGS